MARTDGDTLGRRVAFYRGRRGLSQKELGGLISRSESWVSQVERGARQIDRMSVLEILAEALDVPLVELAPEARVVSAGSERPEAASGLSLALSSSDALQAVLAGQASVDVDRLNEGAARAWDFAHASRYEELHGLLSTLIPEVESAVRNTSGAERRRASVSKARIYHAAAAVLARLGEPGAAWVAVDRAIGAAEEAGDPLLMAEGSFRLALVFQGSRRFELVERTAASAASALTERAESGEPAAVSLQGALFLQLAIAAARGNDGEKAYAELERARAAADALGEDRNDYDTEFGPTNVLVHEVAVAVELGDAGRALRVADRIDTDQISAERHGRLLIDIASAHAQRRQPAEMLASLDAAADHAPQLVATHPTSVALVQDALRGDLANSPGVRKLAQRLNLTT